MPLAIPFVLLCGLGLDRLLGEPKRFHPLVGFGRLANALESRWNAASTRRSSVAARARGLVAVLALLLPFILLAVWISRFVAWYVVDAIALYFTLGWRSLREHALAVRDALLAKDLPRARHFAGLIVTRDTDAMDDEAAARATIESVLENGNDAVFGALFWCLVAGAPGVVAYRLTNTLDAMWGYRSPRFLYFGWAAARLDDVLNFVPARLTAIAYALNGNLQCGLRCWSRQGCRWSSPNAGPVMAAGAGSLGLQLGGIAIYDGEVALRPTLGEGRAPEARDIDTALTLITRSIILWLASITIGVFYAS